MRKDIKKELGKKSNLEIWEPKKTEPVINRFYKFKKPLFIKSLPTTEKERARIQKKGKKPLTMRHFQEAQYFAKRNGKHFMVGTEIRLDGKRPVKCSFELS